MSLNNLYVGWDSREPIAADVCIESIKQFNSGTTAYHLLKQAQLRKEGVYWRDIDLKASTEFTFTRFLVPYLNQYQGWAIFCDCDFLFLADIQELVPLLDDRFAVMVVQHDYQPSHTIKMDGKTQHQYPRKNWSSFIIWNCAHLSNRSLTPELVNTESGQFLHRFSWLKDAEIGNISHTWNWLVDWYHEPQDGYPKVLHYTEGGPWFENYQHCGYAQLWLDAAKQLGWPDQYTPIY